MLSVEIIKRMLQIYILLNNSSGVDTILVVLIDAGIKLSLIWHNIVLLDSPNTTSATNL
jgi:hypothetical protein